jgi:hypothetical protein
MTWHLPGDSTTSGLRCIANNFFSGSSLLRYVESSGLLYLMLPIMKYMIKQRDLLENENYELY